MLKLKPACKDYLWGGHRLPEEYGVAWEGAACAEAWMLSCHPDGMSLIENGADAGKTLSEYIREHGKEVLGTGCQGFQDFPVLIKLIDANDCLSVQVHPDDSYALKEEGQYGKTEMWYVLDAEEGAFLYYGFEREVSREEFEESIRNGSLTELLHAAPVKKGDCFFIQAGTIHAIGKGILIAEIQQNSNVTYRVYDYKRKGKDGKTRELHVEKALSVTERRPAIGQKNIAPCLGRCDYFSVDYLSPEDFREHCYKGNVGADSFLSVLILEGNGILCAEGESLPYKKGDSFFLPADAGTWTMEGECEALLTTVPGLKNH